MLTYLGEAFPLLKYYANGIRYKKVFDEWFWNAFFFELPIINILGNRSWSGFCIGILTFGALQISIEHSRGSF